MPINVSWEFGNNSPIECNDRSCMTVPTYFEKAGEYNIKCTITYADLTKSVATTKLVVE